MSFGIKVNTSEGLVNLADLNDGRATLSHIVRTRNSGSITIPTSLSSAVILVSALSDPIPDGSFSVGINKNNIIGETGDTLSWSFRDSNSNLVNDGVAVHVTILLLGVD
jgi:hypothetical protein